MPVVREILTTQESWKAAMMENRVALTAQRGPLSSVKQCPYCKDMERDAMVCQHCGQDWKTGVAQNEDRELDKVDTSDNVSTSWPRGP